MTLPQRFPAARLWAILAVLTLGACSSTGGVESRSDINPNVDFGNLRTYAFISDNPMMVAETQGPVSPMVEMRLMESVRMAMNGKGYNEARNPEEADMVIAFTVGSRDQIKVDTYPASYGGYYGYGRRGYYSGWGVGMGTETRVRQYTEGQLAVDIFERRTKAPAFHGIATKKITDADREDQQGTINLITSEALADLPYAGGIPASS